MSPIGDAQESENSVAQFNFRQFGAIGENLQIFSLFTKTDRRQ